MKFGSKCSFLNLLAAVLVLGSVACSSSKDSEVSEQVGDEYEYVYVDENGNQVDPSTVESDDYEVVDADDMANSDEMGDLNDSISEAEYAASSDTDSSSGEATDDDLKEMLANINDGQDNLSEAPAAAKPSVSRASKARGTRASKTDSEGYVSLDSDDDSSSRAPAGRSGSGGGIYVVKKGDTLSEIAMYKTGTFRNWPAIAERNNMSNPNLIYPGDRIDLSGFNSTASLSTPIPHKKVDYSAPNGPHVKVERGDTFGTLASKLYGDARQWKSLYEMNKDRFPNPDVLHVGQAVVYSEELASQRPTGAPVDEGVPAEAAPETETSH